MLINDFLDFWEEKIRRDIQPFSDPSSVIDVARTGRTIDVTWTQRLEVRNLTMQVALDSGVLIVFRGERFDYKTFFASSYMADLATIAKMTLQARSRVETVETKAQITDEWNNFSEGTAIDLLRRNFREPNESGATKVVMVTGEAGAGKTVVLQQLVVRQADNFLKGQANCILLYVNAQGRALARLNEALATELQDLRTNLTYHAISTLVRLGLVVPVIDGFDELLGVSGYDDAFSSLSFFIEELSGEGVIIASARSTYYEQEFLSRTNSISSRGSPAWSQASVHLKAWSDQEVEEYLEIKATSLRLDETARAVFRQKFIGAFTGPNASLKEKPFFVSKVAEFVASNAELKGDSDLLDQLVSAYIERERTEKLLSKSGQPLLNADEIRSLFVELAEEMWNQETRELDSHTIQEYAEFFVLANEVSPDAQSVIIERFPTAAFLMPGSFENSIAFEHEVFFSYFLSQRFAERIVNGGSPLGPLFSRATLPDDLAKRTIVLIAKMEQGFVVQDLLNVLSATSKTPHIKLSQISENAGLLATFAIKQVRGEGVVRLDNLVIPGGDLAGVTFNGTALNDIEFRRVDLSLTQFTKCIGKSIFFVECLVDRNSTKLEIEGLSLSENFSGLRIATVNGIETIFEPKKICEVLAGAGAINQQMEDESRQIEESILDLVFRVARAYSQRNRLCITDDTLPQIVNNRYWHELVQIMCESGVAVEETRSASGPAKVFLRIKVLPGQIQRGVLKSADVEGSVRLFWDMLESKYPSH